MVTKNRKRRRNSGSTPPQPLTAQRLRDGWRHDGGRVRLARPGESAAVTDLLADVGHGLDSILKPAIEDGTLAATLCAGLDGGERALFGAAAERVVGRTLLEGLPAAALVLVAENRQGDLVGAVSALTPAMLLAAALETDAEPEQITLWALAVKKIEALVVQPSARRRGWGSQLLRRTVQVHHAGVTLLTYGQFDVGQAHLASFYVNTGFTVQAPGVGLRMDHRLGIPVAVRPGHNEQLFHRWYS